ncbi:MAG TPA: DnaJ domain-containing protein [Chryseosolibacter sp.]
MKDYYQILGVSSSAHASDIKRAYRKLALLYHPDKNPDPSAELYIKEINEAYDVLSDPQSRSAYDLQRENPFHVAVEEPPRHRDPAYKRPTSSRPKRKSESERIYEMMAAYHKPARWMIITAFSFCVLLLFDTMLPVRKSTDQIVDIRHSKQAISRGSYGRVITANILVFASGNRLKISSDDGDHFRIGDYIQINSSRIFGIELDVVGKNAYVANVPVSIYGSFWFGPAALLLISVIGLCFPKKIELTFNLAVGCFFVLILNVIFVLIS